MLLTFKLQVVKHSNEHLLHVSNVHIHNVCMPCHHPCVFVCGQLLCSTCTGFKRYLLYMLTHILRNCSVSAILRSWLCVCRCCACSEKVGARSRRDASQALLQEGGGVCDSRCGAAHGDEERRKRVALDAFWHCHKEDTAERACQLKDTTPDHPEEPPLCLPSQPPSGSWQEGSRQPCFLRVEGEDSGRGWAPPWLHQGGLNLTHYVPMTHICV